MLCEPISIDLSDVSCSSDMHYSVSDLQQCQREPGVLKLCLKVKGDSWDLVSALEQYIPTEKFPVGAEDQVFIVSHELSSMSI